MSQRNCACGAACLIMATLLNISRLGLPISTPSRRCGCITSRVQPGVSSNVIFAALRVSQTCRPRRAASTAMCTMTAACPHQEVHRAKPCSLWLAGRSGVALRPSAQIEGQKPARRSSSGTEGLVLWRPVQQPQRVGLAARAPQRGALLVAQSSLFDRVSRLSRAYVNYYSDAIGRCMHFSGKACLAAACMSWASENDVQMCACHLQWPQQKTPASCWIRWWPTCAPTF